MSGDPVDLGNGVSISQYVGPERTMPDRRRWQLSVIHSDTGERLYVQLDAYQMDSLVMKLRNATGYPL